MLNALWLTLSPPMGSGSSGYIPWCTDQTCPNTIMNAFDIKSSQAPLMALHFKTTDLQAIEQTLTEKLAQNPGFFDGEPVLLDFCGLTSNADLLDLPPLCALLRQQRMNPVACRSATPSHLPQAELNGLFVVDPLVKSTQPRAEREPLPQNQQPPTTPTPTASPQTQPAMIVDKPLRSGQQIYARGRDLVILAMVNPGAEVMSDGHIHVYAPLRGKAIAGAKGDTQARIFTTCLEAELLAIAGTYRTSDAPLPDNLLGKPAHIRLQDERLVMAPM